MLTATRDHRAQVISMGHAAGPAHLHAQGVHPAGAGHRPGHPARRARVAERARALVRAAAALRGWLLAPSLEADEVHDPYGAPIAYFRSIGDEIHTALDPVVTALTGIPATV